LWDRTKPVHGIGYYIYLPAAFISTCPVFCTTQPPYSTHLSTSEDPGSSYKWPVVDVSSVSELCLGLLKPLVWKSLDSLSYWSPPPPYINPRQVSLLPSESPPIEPLLYCCPSKSPLPESIWRCQRGRIGGMAWLQLGQLRGPKISIPTFGNACRAR
jgi:hypothetical protein